MSSGEPNTDNIKVEQNIKNETENLVESNNKNESNNVEPNNLLEHDKNAKLDVSTGRSTNSAFQEEFSYNKLDSSQIGDIANPDFDPFDETHLYPDRSCLSRTFGKISKGSLRGTSISFVAFTIGVGCLTLPYVIMQVGFIPGFILYIITKIANVLMLFLVLEVSLKLRNFNYNDIARKKIGKFFLMVYDISCLINFSGVIMSYLSTIYENVISFVKVMFNVDITKKKMFMYIGVCFIFNIPLCMINDVSRLRIASMIATISIAAIVLTVTIETPFYIKQNINDNKHVQWFKKPSFKYFDALANFMFSYSNQNTLLLVLADMNKPTYRRSTKVINISNIFILILYFCLGFGGYASSLEDTPKVYITRPNLRSMPKDYFNAATKVVLPISLLCIIPLKWSIFRESIKSLWKIEKIPLKYDIPMTVIAMILFNVLVYFTDIITIINFIGGIISVVICFLIPTLDYYYVFPEQRKTPKMIISYIILFVYSIVGTVATVKSVVEFVKK